MYTNKRLQTRQKIIESFMKLYDSNNIDRITVKQICTLANINRSTFYVYFVDVYELLEIAETEMLDIIDENLEPLVKTLKNMSWEKFFAILLPLFQQYTNILPVLLGNANMSFRNKFVDHVKNIILENAPELSDQKMMDLDICLSYHFSAMITVIDNWYRNDMQPPVGHIMEIVKDISENGVFTILGERYLNE